MSLAFGGKDRGEAVGEGAPGAPTPSTVDHSNAPASAPAPEDDLQAALALSCLRLPATGAPPAHTLAHVPGATGTWPFADGKGCFIKGRDGKDLPFLERLYLLLALPGLVLPGHPGRWLGEAIRWKSAEELAAMGLPTDIAAFEINDIALLEAAIYPQYASGACQLPRPNTTGPRASGVVLVVAGGGRSPLLSQATDRALARRACRHARPLACARP